MPILEDKKYFSKMKPQILDSVVISGISGIFPCGANVQEFGNFMINDSENFVLQSSNLLGKFDAEFFGFDQYEANFLDTNERLLLEKSYEAIIDAGINPKTLKGTRCGIYVSLQNFTNEKNIIPNRLSQWMGVHGPSIVVDVSSSSILYALELGYKSIKDGYCDFALIASFNTDTGGVIFLQKMNNAKRVYAEIVYLESIFNEKDILVSHDVQKRVEFLQKLYEQAEINIGDIQWFDPHFDSWNDEEKSMYEKEIFEQLKIPIVSNSSKWTEHSVGISHIAKTIVAMKTGFNPLKDQNVLKKMSDQNVEDKLNLHSDLVAISNYGNLGIECHCVLKYRIESKKFDSSIYKNIPVIAIASGRTLEAVEEILNHINFEEDMEFVCMLRDIFNVDIQLHSYRGFSIFDNNKILTKQIKEINSTSKPVWFIFSNIYDNMPKISLDLLNLDPFNTAISLCHKTLEYKGFDLMSALKDNLKQLNIVELYVCNTAIQIALTDLLTALNIKPDGFIGFNVGEIVAAYADSCISKEQAILLSFYYANLVADCSKCKTIEFSMTEIAADKNEVIGKLNGDLQWHAYRYAHRGIISGSKDSVQEFVKQNGFYQIKNIHWRSHFIETSQTLFKFRELLNQVIDNSAAKSSKWISTAALDNKYCNVEYFVDSLFSNTYFMDGALESIPKDAIVINIGTDYIFDILNFFLKTKDTNPMEIISLLKSNEINNLQSIIPALSNLYTAGVNPNFQILYENPQYPVSRHTKMISPVIRWNHQMNYEVQKFMPSFERIVKISMKDDNMKYIGGHGIGPVILFPGCGYLVLVWETLALMHGKRYTDISVVFENVKFRRATIVPKNGSILFSISIQRSNGNFQIQEKGELVATGYIFTPNNLDNYKSKSIADNNRIHDDSVCQLKSDDFYKCLKIRGYNYKHVFRSILDITVQGTRGHIKWAGNWVTYLDGMLQVMLLLDDTNDGLIVPTAFDRIVIDVEMHNSILKKCDLNFPVYTDKILNLTESGGVQIKNGQYKPIPRKSLPKKLILLKYGFIPLISEQDISMKIISFMVAQILMENFQLKSMDILQVTYDNDHRVDYDFLSLLSKAIDDLPLFQINIASSVEIKNTDYKNRHELCFENCYDLIICHGILQKQEECKILLSCLNENGFILTGEVLDKDIKIPKNLKICLSYKSGQERILLIRKEVENTDPIIIKASSNHYHWISELQNALVTSKNRKIYLISEKEPFCGILGFFNCLRMERDTQLLRCVFVMDESAPEFSLSNEFYRSQLSCDFAINIFKDGKWGKYLRYPLEPLKLVNAEYAYIGLEKVGNTQTLNWFKGPIDVRDVGYSVRIYYGVINPTDALLMSGRLAVEAIIKCPMQKEYAFGIEFSGIDNYKKRVMGICRSGALSTLILPDKDFLFELPSTWSLDEACTVPLSYVTAIYTLVYLSKIKFGNSILIHGAGTVISQAAINIAIFYNCEIFVTVSNELEKLFIQNHYPQIPEKCILKMNVTFEQDILRETLGNGVNLIFNIFGEELLPSSLNCLSTDGHFMQLKSIEFNKINTISPMIFKKNITFHSGAFEDIMDLPSEQKSEIKVLFNQHIKNGAIKPLNKKIFNDNELNDALRFAISNKNMCKTMIRIWPNEDDKNSTKNVIPKFLCSKLKTYVICGGLGGIGLELINWLVSRGARNIILTSRSGVIDGYQRKCIDTWKKYGANIIISKANISEIFQTEELLREANSLGSVAAIFNLAGVIVDKIFKKQTEETFKISAEAKSLGTYNLDMFSRMMCPNLEHFVVFSSISCGYGNIGQTNYGMSNSTAERICEKRKNDNLPALAIQWGAVGDVGMAVNLLGENTDISIGGTELQPIKSCMESLEQFLLRNDTIVTSFILANKRK